ncbi:unnamed protein product [Clonostachys byssicola]|uniref:Alpha/beta hydrolase fold-3 domain-containing protein n=1 Tax=Clonostachys byssicola TaxID=160290 RepID=A0A9N9Y2N3_9HYPO|nr:unnamed protein product [Clonostachys byssicola]
MDSPNVKMLVMLLPKLPLVVRETINHILGLSEPSKYLDLHSALVISVLRSMIEPSASRPQSISSVQKLTLKDPGVKGRLWVSTYASPPPPETSIRDELMHALEDMRGSRLEGAQITAPELVSVEAEWTGYRPAASAKEPLPSVSNKELYSKMMEDCRQPTTILYLHGGAFYVCDPITHRPVTSKLAKLTGGRCYSVRYRLSPQHPFPAALLDALFSYMTLLYPPPDAYHEPVKPQHLAIAGDSAGGNLTLALLQLLLQLRRRNATILWHGERREIPLPAAVGCNSPWLDITQSFPSWEGDECAPFDYLPKPATVEKAGVKDCAVWPASPPRKYLYVDDELVTHPLATVLMSKSWEGAPPVYICTGWEILGPEDKFFAKKLAADGVPVVLEEYEAMPHCFAAILTKTPGARRCFDGWAGFIRAAVADPANAPESRAVVIEAKTLKETRVEFESLSTISEEEIQARILAKAGLTPIASQALPKL